MQEHTGKCKAPTARVASAQTRRGSECELVHRGSVPRRGLSTSCAQNQSMKSAIPTTRITRTRRPAARVVREGRGSRGFLDVPTGEGRGCKSENDSTEFEHCRMVKLTVVDVDFYTR